MQTISSKHLLIALYSACFLALASFAVWDISIIIHDYVTDNRMIAASHEPIANTFPFLNETNICLVYKPDYLFPTKMGNKSAYTSMLFRHWRNEEMSWPSNMTDLEKSAARSIFDLVLAFNLTKTLDEDGPYGFDRMMNDSGADLNFLFSVVDRFIADPNSTRVIVEAQNTVQPHFIRSVNQPRAKIPIGYVQYYSIICFDVSFAEFLSVQNHKTTFALDLVQRDQKDEYIRRNSGLFVRFSSTENLDMPSGPSDQLTKIRIAISNNAIFDSSQFPPCTEIYETELECLRDLRVRTISKWCNCSQFSNFLYKVLRTGVDTPNGTPFCTSDVYKECWDKAMIEVQKEQLAAKDAGSCMPCDHAKNSYTVSTYMTPLSRIDETWTPRLYLTLECTDRAYFWFEEKSQFIFSQLLSQIGGDLGLYVGFSMMSILNLLMFLYNARRNKTPYSVRKLAHPGLLGGVRSLFEELQADFGQKHSPDGDGLAERTSNVEQKVERMEQEIENLVKEVAGMNKNLRDMTQVARRRKKW